MAKRVVVTGMGIASPLGCSLKTAYDRLKIYKNCVSYQKELDEFDNMNTRLTARVNGFKIPENFNRKITRTMGKVSIIAVTTAIDALKDADLIGDSIISDGRTGVSYGSSTGSLDAIMDFYSMCSDKTVKNITSSSYVKLMPHTTAVNISLYFKTHGRLITTSTACTSGSLAIGSAYELIKNGEQTIMIAGGAEEYHSTQVAVFDTLYATSIKNNTPDSTPRPFDKDRDGLVIGEGGATLVLEEYEHAKSRGVKIYAEIVGYDSNTDGNHITNPSNESIQNLLEKTLDKSHISKNQIGYINAHGTATILGDVAESTATYNVFRNKCPISSIKSYTGHTLGGCGAIETVLSIEMMNNNWFCPTLNLENPDEKCAELDYIMNEARIIDTEYVMTNNFAFGGINTSIILKRI